MTATSILHFTTTSETALQAATDALNNANLPGPTTLGPHIQDPSTIQLTTETDTTPFLDILTPILAAPTKTLTLPFPVLSHPGPATFPVVEYVQNFFPVATLTPSFRTQIEADFLTFFTALVPGGPAADPGKIVTGWSDEVAHPDSPDERARCWTVCRGWRTMGDFLRSVETEEFERAIPVLYAWGRRIRCGMLRRRFRAGEIEWCAGNDRAKMCVWEEMRFEAAIWGTCPIPDKRNGPSAISLYLGEVVLADIDLQ